MGFTLAFLSIPIHIYWNQIHISERLHTPLAENDCMSTVYPINKSKMKINKSIFGCFVPTIPSYDFTH